ncbi:hypothetical protein BH11PSE8_BH11PSE8_06380 [soil metagenome]
MNTRSLLSATLIVLFAGVPVGARAQADRSACGSLQNAYGPLDYRTDRGEKLKIVEDYHFGPAVEALIRGVSSSVGADLDYTLRAFPNHHRALLAIMRLGEKTKSQTPTGAHFSVECYFDRAIRFRPDDTTVRMIYAMFLYSKAREADAAKQLEVANQLAEDNAFTHYNIGLVYFDNRDYQRALEQAHRAIELGFSRTELKEKLAAVGKWSEPVAKPKADAGLVPDESAAGASAAGVK